MKSIGISLKNTSNRANPTPEENAIHLHLNIWKSPPRFSFRNEKDPFYLDIGIMAKFATSEMKVYLPFALKEEEAYEDLAHILIDNKPILCALFNDDYNINQVNTGCYHLVTICRQNDRKTDDKKNPPTSKLRMWWNRIKGQKENRSSIPIHKNDLPDAFYLYNLGADDITAKRCRERNTEGWIFNIKIPNQEEFPVDTYYYVRFRVIVTDPLGLALQTDLSNDLIQSAFTKLDMYNLQFNELRDIPYGPKGALKADQYKFALFSKIHILYISNPKVSIENGSPERTDCRLIAPRKWMSYLPEGYPLDTYVAHHWKFANKDGSAFEKKNLYFSAKYPKLQLPTFLAYAGFIVILGCVGSCLASLTIGKDSISFGIVGLFLFILLAMYCTVWYISTHWNNQ